MVTISNMRKTASHPLFILIIGTIISGILIPTYANNWQNSQKELEIKQELVSQIAGSTSNMLGGIQFNAEKTSQTKNEYNEIYKKWNVESSIIDAKLRAYFPESDLIERWRVLVEAMDITYLRSIDLEYDFSMKHIVTKYSYTYDEMNEIDYKILDQYKTIDRTSDNYGEYVAEWGMLTYVFMVERDSIIQQILSEPIRQYD